MKAYFELLDQPEVNIAYTPIEDRANISNIPNSKSLNTIQEPNGNTDHTNKPKVSARIGAKKYRNKLTWLGITISLENSLTPSAKGCRSP